MGNNNDTNESIFWVTCCKDIVLELFGEIKRETFILQNKSDVKWYEYL